MSKQRKFVLISAAAGFIAMFLPWVSVMGINSANGMRDKGILVFICFVASGVLAYLGDQTKNLDKSMWSITLLAGAIALLFTVWFYFQLSDTFMGVATPGFGLYIAALAAIGVLGSAYLFKSPTDNIKDGFNSIKKEIESKIGNSTGGAPTSPPPPTPPIDEIPPGPANSNPTL